MTKEELSKRVFFDKSFHITQLFSENPAMYPNMKGHNGVDIGVPVSTDGTVLVRCYIESNNQGSTGYGLNVRGYTNDAEYVYAHLSKVLKTGWCNPGDKVFKTGNTGRSTGPHIHIGIRPRKGFKGPIISYNNGYFGWVNPLSYGTAAKTIAKIKAVIRKDRVYIVKRGDTLTKISKLLKVGIPYLAKKNSIKNINLIQVGQKLKY